MNFRMFQSSFLFSEHNLVVVLPVSASLCFKVDKRTLHLEGKGDGMHAMPQEVTALIRSLGVSGTGDIPRGNGFCCRWSVIFCGSATRQTLDPGGIIPYRRQENKIKHSRRKPTS